jgi:hypothetical protein
VLTAVAAGAAPARTDAEIEHDIRSRFAKSKIASSGFEVKVRAGVATLTGKTDIVQHKGVATRMAKNAGAVQVVNKIEVGKAAREKAAVTLTRSRRPPAKAPAGDAAAPPGPGSVPPPVRKAQVKH